MPSKKTGRKPTGVETVLVRVEKSIVDDAGYIAQKKGLKRPQYLSDLLRPLVARDLQDVLDRREKAAETRKARTNKP